MRKSKITIIAIIILMISGVVNLRSQGKVNNFLKEPYLIFNNDVNGMRLMWQLEKYNNATLYLTQGELGVNDSFFVKEINDEHQFVYNFETLKPNKKYFYIVKSKSFTRGGSFYSRVDSTAKDFVFYAYGDTRTFPEKHNQVARQIMLNIASDPNSQTFVVSTGDLVANGDLEEDWDEQFFDNSFFGIRELMASMPYMVSVGNHEGQGSLFAKYFPYDLIEQNSFYYSFNYGNTHFTAIDQFSDLDEDSEQYKWLENDLKTSKEDWKIVLIHKPGWTAGGHKNNKAVQRILQPLFEKYNVKLVLAGHNHYYARAMVNGICHITTGGGGAPLYKPKKSKDKIVIVDESLHFLKISVDKDKVLIKVIRADGSVIEKFEIKK
ncbi:MAG: hypothetical protein DRI86_13010 [Bacteroidetes bacterium]|nr:MAG: hypothetical protein DRI86_13010 [Bacteroidota bacterium]